MYVLVFLLEVLCTLHSIAAEAPVIQSQLDSVVVVSSDVFTTVNGVRANLALPCSAQGRPTPSIKWFREDIGISYKFINSDGTLVLNVTFNSEASREGKRYYCTATNSIGSSTYTARNFDGFESRNVVTTQIPTVEEGSVALKCDYKEAMPLPVIEWYRNNGDTPIFQSINDPYLYMHELTAAQRNSDYHCVVANAYLGTNPQRSPVTYSLSNLIPVDELITYVDMENWVVTMELGSSIKAQYAVAVLEDVSLDVKISLFIREENIPPGVTISSNGLVFSIISVIQTPDDYEIPVSIVYSNGRSMVTLQIQVRERAYITHPTESRIIQEKVVGMSVVYTCENRGLPVPVVSWYYNGASVMPEGITVTNESTLSISSLQVNHSGVYQCFVENFVIDSIRKDSRTWVLQVRSPIVPQIEQVRNSNNMIIEDSLVGLLLFTEGFNSPAVIISVYSDPCPTVQWMFNGTPISTDSNYIVSNPCNNEHGLTTNFTLSIITRHTMSRSGRYTALFSHIGGSATSPSIYITVPVPVTLSSLSVEVESTGEQQPACLPEGSSVILTCGFTGLVRPSIRFRKDSEVLNTDFCGRFSIIGTGKMRISRVEMIDEGVYTCETETENGTVIQLTPTPSILTVCSFPEIRAFQLPEFPVSGRELALHCAVTGTPLVTVTWFKDSQPLISSSNLNILNDNGVSRVGIGAVSQEDGGEYVCRATNEAGSSSANWSIRLPNTTIASATSTSSVTESDPTTSLISGSTSRSVPESTSTSVSESTSTSVSESTSTSVSESTSTSVSESTSTSVSESTSTSVSESTSTSVSESTSTSVSATNPGMNLVYSLSTFNSGGHNVRAGSCLMVSMILSSLCMLTIAP